VNKAFQPDSPEKRLRRFMRASVPNPSKALIPEEGPTFRGVVVYEDDRTRDRGLRLYNKIEREFWSEIEFEFSWWRFDYLGDPDLAREAAGAATRADWVVFSAHGGLELPPVVRKWIETWSSRKANRTSAMVALVGVENDAHKGMTPIHNYLREVAQQAGMDYFAHVLEAWPNRPEVSINEIERRAGEVTAVLDDIIHRPSIPTHWGINE
jgi:hypothetical protein